MAQLSSDPKDAALEDFVAAHFASRGAYVETGITERNPIDILELDVVWTNYSHDPPRSHPVEITSGKDIHLGDLFKFYGWTRYLGLPSGQFVHREPFSKADENSLTHIAKKTGIHLVHGRGTVGVSARFTFTARSPTRRSAGHSTRSSGQGLGTADRMACPSSSGYGSERLGKDLHPKSVVPRASHAPPSAVLTTLAQGLSVIYSRAASTRCSERCTANPAPAAQSKDCRFQPSASETHRRASAHRRQPQGCPGRSVELAGAQNPE